MCWSCSFVSINISITNASVSTPHIFSIISFFIQCLWISVLKHISLCTSCLTSCLNFWCVCACVWRGSCTQKCVSAAVWQQTTVGGGFLFFRMVLRSALGSTPAPLDMKKLEHLYIYCCKSSLRIRKSSMMSCRRCLNIASDGRWAIICNLDEQKTKI